MRLIVLLMLAMTATLAATTVRADAVPADFAGLLDAHNTARQSLGITPLRWSNTLARDAQRWADQLASEDCKLRYDPDPSRRETTGQNLFRAYGSAPYQGYKRSSAEAADRWVLEGAQYDHEKQQCRPGLGSQCGAYLQVIWEATTAVGCGRARCAAAEVWACHYSPRGGQDDLKPYGNSPQASPVPVSAPVQQCGWMGPTPAQQFSDALNDKLPPP